MLQKYLSLTEVKIVLHVPVIFSHYAPAFGETIGSTGILRLCRIVDNISEELPQSPEFCTAIHIVGNTIIGRSI